MYDPDIPISDKGFQPCELAGWLAERVRAVNFVWNWRNNAQVHALRHNQKWPRAFDVRNLATGSSKLLGLHSQTVQAVCERYVQSRSDRQAAKLRYRSKKRLGWLPFKASGIVLQDDRVRYAGRWLTFWNSRPMPDGARVTVGSVVANARGQWFLNITMELPDEAALAPQCAVGIDLGLKAMATTSDGLQTEAARFYRHLEPALAIAQRVGKGRWMQALHRKIAKRRSDRNQKVSTTIARASGLIVVGNVSAHP